MYLSFALISTRKSHFEIRAKKLIFCVQTYANTIKCVYVRYMQGELFFDFYWGLGNNKR